MAAQAAGFLLPLAAALAWFRGQGALAAFLECNFAINARWPGLGPREFVLRFLADEPVFVALAVAGFLRTAPALAAPRGLARTASRWWRSPCCRRWPAWPCIPR